MLRGYGWSKNHSHVTRYIYFKSENQKREYSFDYSIWSHDGFTALPNGLMVPNG
jgi:hypothetical protein